jgi:hypothetical protein
MELNDLQDIEKATKFGRNEMFHIGTAMLFIVMIMLYASTIDVLGRPFSIELVVAAMIGGYMAMNIGVNDVANNVGPAVGSSALTLTGAIIIAGIFEASGALIAGGDVVSTIKKGIIDPNLIPKYRNLYLGFDGCLAGRCRVAEHGNRCWRTRVHYTLYRGRSIGRGYRGGGLGYSQLGHHGENRCELGHLPCSGRHHRRIVPLLDQTLYHL